MILMKLGEDYKLYSHDSCIATTHESPHKRLSKENCDELLEVVDVDDLAYKHRRVYQDSFEWMNECIMKDAMHQQVGFVAGFNKAMELQKDKLFTIDDIKIAMVCMQGQEVFYEKTFEETQENRKLYIENYIKHLLQQPTKIEVEIVMETCQVMVQHGDIEFQDFPKLDENGCIVLRKL